MKKFFLVLFLLFTALNVFAQFEKTGVETRLALNGYVLSSMQTKKKKLEEVNIPKDQISREMRTFFYHLIDGILLEPSRGIHKEEAWKSERRKCKSFYDQGYEHLIKMLIDRRAFLEECSDEKNIKKKIKELEELLE